LKKSSGKEKTLRNVDQKSIFASQRNTLTEFYPLSGKEVLNRIQDHDRPRQLIRNLAGKEGR
jgi:hypothetical protein